MTRMISNKRISFPSTSIEPLKIEIYRHQIGDCEIFGTCPSLPKDEAIRVAKKKLETAFFEAQKLKLPPPTKGEAFNKSGSIHYWFEMRHASGKWEAVLVETAEEEASDK